MRPPEETQSLQPERVWVQECARYGKWHKLSVSWMRWAGKFVCFGVWSSIAPELFQLKEISLSVYFRTWSPFASGVKQEPRRKEADMQIAQKDRVSSLVG